MNTNKFIVGGIIGGIAYFILGYLVWGMLLMSFMENNAGTAQGVMKEETDLVWWALIVGNLFGGWALSYVLLKAGAKTAGAGAGVGAAITFLVAASYDFVMLGTTNMMTITGALVDIAASAVVGAIVGAAIGWYFGMGKKEA